MPIPTRITVADYLSYSQHQAKALMITAIAANKNTANRV